jgi:hypothetical protein
MQPNLTSDHVRTVRDVAKPLEEWSVEELRAELVAVGSELAKRAATPAAGKKQRNVVVACENWVRGLAWDETFTVEMVQDELAVHERKVGQELAPLDRERLIQLWLALRDERYRHAA